MKRDMRLWLESLEWGKFSLTFGGNGLSKFADWLLVKLVCVFQQLGNLAWVRWGCGIMAMTTKAVRYMRLCARRCNAM
jgi:hypothetical protein